MLYLTRLNIFHWLLFIVITKHAFCGNFLPANKNGNLVLEGTISTLAIKQRLLAKLLVKISISITLDANFVTINRVSLHNPFDMFKFHIEIMGAPTFNDNSWFGMPEKQQPSSTPQNKIVYTLYKQLHPCITPQPVQDAFESEIYFTAHVNYISPFQFLRKLN